MTASVTTRDPHSCANVADFVATHLHLDLLVDFSRSILTGSVEISLRRLAGTMTVGVILDAAALNVHSVHCEDQIVSFQYLSKASLFGDSLVLDVAALLSDWPVDSTRTLKIAYETTAGCTAAQWLTPEQTIGKMHPFLFTQCQPIHARSLLPCQDSPIVKTTYSATIRIARGLAVVMSANRRNGPIDHIDDNTHFEFAQTTPVPSYLIALGAGHLASRPIGPRSSVWCEPETLDAAAWEFADTETFLRIGEEIAGPYVWERYDILLLPPSFPYGGMENPCLTFLTPSLLAGDRSLVDVVAHEIAHSWTGNLVTAATWEHFWLNEGFTMFLERKIIGRLHGESVRQFNAVVGLANLHEAIGQFGPTSPATQLVPNLATTHPDDVFSAVPYEKGHTLLAFIEQVVGGPAVFDPILRAYIDHFAGRSITTADFCSFLATHIVDPAIRDRIAVNVDWDAWLHRPGPPPQLPNYDQSLMAPCEQLARDIADASAPVRFRQLSLDQKLVLLDKLAETDSALTLALLEKLDTQFGLGAEQNVELCLKWYLLAVRAGYTPVIPAVLRFVTRHGRMKYNRPLYRELYRLGGEARDAAIAVFIAHRAFYHPIAASMIEKDLKLVLFSAA